MQVTSNYMPDDLYFLGCAWWRSRGHGRNDNFNQGGQVRRALFWLSLWGRVRPSQRSLRTHQQPGVSPQWRRVRMITFSRNNLVVLAFIHTIAFADTAAEEKTVMCACMCSTQTTKTSYLNINSDLCEKKYEIFFCCLFEWTNKTPEYIRNVTHSSCCFSLQIAYFSRTWDPPGNTRYGSR